MRAGAGAVTAFALVVLGCNAWVHLASRGAILDAASAPERPVALVLGAGVFADGTPTPFLAARLDVAARLFEQGTVTTLLLSGDGDSAHHDEPAAMRRYLLARGVPPEAMVLDPAGLDTYDSCVRTGRDHAMSPVIVVSQTYHLPRALAVCRAIGLDAVGVGDSTMREVAPAVWAEGRAREVLAAVKAAWDVLSRRDPAASRRSWTETSPIRHIRSTIAVVRSSG